MSAWWEHALWVAFAVALFFIAVVQVFAGIYGYQRARRDPKKGVWDAITEAAATATGNGYIVHVCKGPKKKRSKTTK